MTQTVELITAVRPRTRRAAEFAVRAEEAGWHGIGFLDNQNLCGDVYVCLALAAAATERIQLSTDVTNPVTRHPAVTAGAIASIQEVSGGRASLGIGRGDSALAFVGHAPAYTRLLESYLKALQAYLRGDSVAFGELTPWWRDMAPPVDAVQVADASDESRLRWIDSRDTKVPVYGAATGPRVIGTVAKHADIVMFALGADIERLRWGLQQARAARREEGLDPDGVRYGAYLNVVCHSESESAPDSIPFLDTFVRFSTLHGKTHGPATKAAKELFASAHEGYRMWDRGPSLDVSAEFVDRFAIVGPPDTCIRRIQEIVDLGIERIVVMGPTVDDTDDAPKRYAELMVREVLPALAN